MVHMDADDDLITLTQYTGPAHRSVDHQIGLSPAPRVEAESAQIVCAQPLSVERVAGADRSADD
jgi:hypothetical protein